MDTSDKLASVRKAMRSASTRTRIAALEILAEFRSSTACLSGFCPLEDFIAGTEGISPWDRTHWQFSRITHAFPSNVSKETFVRHVEVLADDSGITEQKLFRRSRESRWSHKKFLIVSREGEVLIWDLTIRYARRGKKCTAKAISKFRTVSGRALRKYLDEELVGRALIASIAWAITATVDTPERSTVAVQELNAFVVDVEKMLVPIFDVS
jgi:hypothetical protein